MKYNKKQHTKLSCRSKCFFLALTLAMASVDASAQKISLGSCITRDGGQFKGEMVSGKPQGKGTTIYKNGDNYNPIKRDGFLVVKRDYKCVRIPIDDILFVDCDKDYIRFHLEGRPNIRTLGNLKQLEERLPREKFKRVHRSFLANMTKFDTVDQQHITYGDQSIPISETYFEFIKKYLEDHSL